MFDEQPDGDIHGECAAEIHRQECEITRLHLLSACEACIEIPAVGEYIKQIEAQRDALALQNKELRDALIYHQEQTRPIQSTIEALSLPDLSTSIIQQHDNEVIERCAVLCEKSDRYRGDYFAEKIRALKQ